MSEQDQTAEHDKRVKELTATIARLKAQVALDESLAAKSTRTIQELEAHINKLREALLASIRYVPEYSKSLDSIQQALAQTPAQSLQAHDNEVIERCAKVCEETTKFVAFQSKDYYVFAKKASEEIRALKGKQNG